MSVNAQTSKRKPAERPQQSQNPTAYPCVQAFEAAIVYEQHSTASEVSSRSVNLPVSRREQGRGLVQWREGTSIWADRHDGVHLLEDLPSCSPIRCGSPESSSSWGSLPSDEGATFYISDAEEYEEYGRAKRQEWVSALREERLREREKEDVADDEHKSRNDTEEPTPAILTLMRHTAKSLADSPNSHILEMKILANHANDERFSFLRGRYAQVWAQVKEAVRRASILRPAPSSGENKAVGSLLGGYDSDDDSTQPGSPEGEEPPPPPPETPPPYPP